MPALFDHYIVVDWSAANQKKRGRDSIWIGHLGPAGESCENPDTRHRAKMILSERLAGAVCRDERVLIGFDFPFGYPSGFAARLRLEGPPWRAVWDEIARLITDDERNRNNRFKVAAQLNERVSGSVFPFWGRPGQMHSAFLSSKHHRRHDAGGLREKRLVDTWMVGAQPCWKLLGAGAVGGQVLTGIPVVRELHNDPRWTDHARIWPFETGLGLGDEARIVFAEIWPSWFQVRGELGPPKDRAQVRTLAAILAKRDRTGELGSWFAPPIGEAEVPRVVEEEAWTLGVMEAGQRAMRSSNPAIPPAAPTRTLRALPSPARGGGSGSGQFTYLHNPAAISRRSTALIRAEADLARFPRALRPMALRLAQAAGDASILDHLAWSRGAIGAGTRALKAGVPILVDATMVAAGISRERLPAANEVLCTLSDAAVATSARLRGGTRSAAAVELWRPHLSGAVVAIGNAPTALFRLLELIAADDPKPALILGFPVGFVGAAEAKRALAEFGSGLAFVTLHGRRGGSALAAAAVNALAGGR